MNSMVKNEGKKEMLNYVVNIKNCCAANNAVKTKKGGWIFGLILKQGEIGMDYFFNTFFEILERKKEKRK